MHVGMEAWIHTSMDTRLLDAVLPLTGVDPARTMLPCGYAGMYTYQHGYLRVYCFPLRSDLLYQGHAYTVSVSAIVGWGELEQAKGYANDKYRNTLEASAGVPAGRICADTDPVHPLRRLPCLLPCILTGMHTYGFTYMRVCILTGMRVCILVGLRVCGYACLRVCWFAYIPACGFASIPARRLEFKFDCRCDCKTALRYERSAKSSAQQKTRKQMISLRVSFVSGVG